MAQKVVNNVKLGLQTGTDRTLYVTWEWLRKHVDHYSVKWYYDTGDSVWFLGNESSVKEKQCTYSAPSNANRVKVTIKPVSSKYKKNGKDVGYWSANWSTEKIYRFKEDNTTPEIPSVPTLTIDKHTLTATVDVYDSKTDGIEFQIVQDDSKVFGTCRVKKTKNHAEVMCSIITGHTYKVRCRGLKGKFPGASANPWGGDTPDVLGSFEHGKWSDYSQNEDTIPNSIYGIVTCIAASETSAKIEWIPVANAESYEIEYTSNKEWFDATNETQTLSLEGRLSNAIIPGLDSGKEWFFRVRAVNDKGPSAWSFITSTVLGTKPAPPTTWSSTVTAVIGEDVTLYWVHNSEDGSSQTYAELELAVGGTKKVLTVQNSIDENERNETSSYVFSTSEYSEGALLQWRVRTKGVIDEYGDWSIQRMIEVYAPPVLTLNLSGTYHWYWDTFNFEKDTVYTALGDLGEPLETLASFPLYILATSGPNSQKPVGYYLTITANEPYQTVDSTGREVCVNANEQVFSKNYDVSDYSLFVTLTASDLDLENNISYTVHCMVSMDSGLTAETSYEFTVAWTDEQYEPDAGIGIDTEIFAAYIQPYCEDDEGNLIEGVLLSVYRREYDGSFVELAKDIDNGKGTTITDPHPALDYARYRIVAMSRATGAISFYDPPGYPVGGIAAILQWDEQWSSFDSVGEDEAETPVWSGSMLKLPYNLDVSDKHGVDVSLVKYIGRRHPVSYYGTQIGETSNWSLEIPSEDKETLYALRRLAAWTGDVYVREPSGSGYWAQVDVSFSQKHCEVTIPVTLDITRVEGGV